jgi:hypothetical protein
MFAPYAIGSVVNGFDPITGAYSSIDASAPTPFPPFIDEDLTIPDVDNTLGIDDGVVTPGGYSYTGWTIQGYPVITDGSTVYVLHNNDVAASAAPGMATAVAEYTLCFVEGTRIQTPMGDQRVESLAIGDTILNHRGQAITVKWIGRQTRNPRFAILNEQMPIQITAGALGEGLPSRDLYLSPDHALLVDGCLVHASALVNGRTITQATTWEGDIEYYHIETEGHEIILAEGTPAETFIDNVSRKTFDNHADYDRLYPDAGPMVELDQPRVKFARQLPMAIRRRLEALADEREVLLVKVV